MVAALLPCFWIYWDVASAITRSAVPENCYQAWIDTYADEAFGAAVARVIGTADAAAAASPDLRRAMLGAFSRSTQYEFLFWEGAYQMRGWPSPD